ncbi:hypothetical protein GCM10010145_44530 [Streptomyces ruber]|uniref:Polyketide synthase n=2 Tax=Streptomyces TaxID=1883 RepID=A0A918BJ37_9ACTN|nr:hypothetical protein GCM10010145_44530 [Streptomyces ruber]
MSDIVLTEVAALLKVDARELDPDVELSEYGLDSIVMSQLANQLNEALGLELMPTVLFEHPTLRAFSTHLVEDHGPAVAARLGPTRTPAAAPPPPPSPSTPPQPTPPPALPAVPDRTGDPIAVIGMSARFPQAEDVDAFWRNLSEGRDCITEIPEDRWDWRAHYGDPKRDRGRTDVKYGGFIDGVADFDPMFFGISPKEALLMDPQQRLLMLYVWKALEDAGYAADSLAGSDLGLFVGTTNTGYSNLVERTGGAVESVSSTGGVPSVGPNRMSYFLDVHGPSEPVETACSSSLVALHRAVAAIERGECGMAVVGGVNTIVVPDGHISFSKAGMLAVDGRCKTFSDAADGYVRGEGVGMLVLKRLAEAERDGDHVYGVIRATSENHGGRANSLTSPNPRAQAALVRRAWARAGIDPRTVGYIEAHGTGTSLGDPVEVNGLKAAFAELYAAHGASVTGAHVGLGSVKTNIGHLELAAGVAGVIKVLLQMRHRTLVASLHCERVNPYIELEGSPFYLVRERQEWAAPRDAEGRELPRRAGVSSFGFGGVNAHVVLEEYVPPTPAGPDPADREPVAVLLSAADPETLRTRVRDLVAWIDAGHVGADDLAALAHTLQVGRVAMEERLGLVTDSLTDLRARLASFLDDGRAQGVHVGRAGRQEAWATLTADEDTARAIDGWIARGNLNRLVRLWTTGCDFDWRRLYAGRRPRRIPLPAYSFRLRRYWVADRAGGAGEEPKGNERSRRLDGREPYLTDHRVFDVPTVPGAAHVEFVRDALTRSVPDAPAGGVRLRDVTWLRPLRVTAPHTLRIALRPIAGGGGTVRAFEVRSDDTDGVYAQGTAELDPALREVPAETHDIDALRAGCPQRRDAAECYGLFARMGLDYGPALRAIETLHHGPDGALARLRLPAEAAGLTVDPSMLDGALQATLGVLLSEREHDRGTGEFAAALPFTVREVQVLRPTPATGWAVVRRADDDRGPAASLRRLDVDLCDDRGTVCVRLLGFSTRTVRTEAREPEKTREPQETSAMLIRVDWQDAEDTTAEEACTGKRHVVLCELEPSDAAVPALARALDGTCESWQADGDVAARYTEYARRLLTLLRDLARDSARGTRLVQVVTPADTPWLAGLSGMLRTARAEHPQLLTQLIETDGRPTVEGLADSLRRAGADPAEEAVRVRRGRRRVPRWRELPAPDRTAALPWRDGGVYLLTGGAGGLGAAVARDIARRVAHPVLVLCGRSPAGAAHDGLLADLRASGATAEYRVLDVADRDAVLETVRAVETAHGALNGVVHAAGVLRDGYLAAKSAEDLREVLAAKVDGLLHLDEASAASELDCFIGFSSMAAFGNAGQADYAAANAFMDAFAAHRAGLAERGDRPGRTLAVNWPLWQEGGMRAGARAVTLMEQAGLRPLDTATGLDALYRAWAAGQPNVIVAHGDHARIREQFLPATDTATATAPVPASNSEPAADRLAALLADVLELDPAELKRDVPLRRYGFDSIFQVQFLTRAQSEIDPELTLEVLADSETLQDLVEAIGGAGDGDARPATEPESESGPASAPEPEPEPGPGHEPESEDASSVLVRMNGVTDGRPVFWVHDGNGGVGGYAPLAARSRRPFYGIVPKGWTGSGDILVGQEAMARHYVAAIRSVQPEGPYDIGGFSLGGLFAYEMVRELQAQGQDVSSFVMLDTLDGTATNRANALVLGGRDDADARAKTSLFRAVNLVLGDNRLTGPGEASPILRRDEVDTTLGREEFLDSLIEAALARGVDRTEARLRARVHQLARYFDAVQGETYAVRPLPRPDEVPCHYVRNKGGEFFGEYEEYMVLFPASGLPPVDGTEYWREWERNIGDFTVTDVDTVTHSDVLAAPHALEKVLELCDTLYAPDDPRPSTVTSASTADTVTDPELSLQGGR